MEISSHQGGSAGTWGCGGHMTWVFFTRIHLVMVASELLPSPQIRGKMFTLACYYFREMHCVLCEKPEISLFAIHSTPKWLPFTSCFRRLVDYAGGQNSKKLLTDNKRSKYTSFGFCLDINLTSKGKTQWAKRQWWYNRQMLGSLLSLFGWIVSVRKSARMGTERISTK